MPAEASAFGCAEGITAERLAPERHDERICASGNTWQSEICCDRSDLQALSVNERCKNGEMLVSLQLSCKEAGHGRNSIVELGFGVAA